MIALSGISKSFGATKVLHNVSLTIPDATSLAILGRSGTGKSVLARIILGLEQADAGRVSVDGVVQTRRARAAFLANCGVLFQGAALFDSLTVWENIAFRLRNGPNRQSKRDARRQADEMLERVGLAPDIATLFPADLSGGMQKRVGLARAIIGAPKYLVFDEPNSGLDPVTAADIDDLIRSLVTDLGATAITITHDMASIRRIADHVVLLDAGNIRWQGAVSLLETSGDPVLAQFLMRSFPSRKQ